MYTGPKLNFAHCRTVVTCIALLWSLAGHAAGSMEVTEPVDCDLCDFCQDLPGGQTVGGCLGPGGPLGGPGSIDGSGGGTWGGGGAVPTPLPLPDLTSSPGLARFAPATIRRGSPLEVEIPIANIGVVDAGPFRTVIVLSRDRFIGPGDIVVGELDAIYGMPIGDQIYVFDVRIPSSTPAGDYFVGWFHDAYRAVPELDERNNAGTAPPRLRVLP